MTIPVAVPPDTQPRPKPVGHEDLNSNWVGAGHLKIGDTIKQADGTVGVVANVTTIQHTQEMFNLTVDEAHTFYVGQNGWLVHNTDDCDYPYLRRRSPSTANREYVNQSGSGIDPVYGYHVDRYEADHIYPLNKFPELPGYNLLTREEKLELARLEENMMGLGKSTNASNRINHG